MKILKLLAFDLDDTLFPEKSYVYGAFKAVSDSLKKERNIDAKELYAKLVETKKLIPSGRILDIVLKKYQLDAKQTEKLVQIYREHPTKLRLFPGTRKVLQKLKKTYILAIITNGSQAVQNKKLDYLKIKHYFNSVIYTLDLGNNFKKPSKLPFQKLLVAHGVKPEETLYIGNNPDSDFLGAKQVGIKTIRINQRFYKGRNAHKIKDADFTIKNISQLPSLINKMSKL
jgi:putative hydrolase of the HAD superfamily